MCAIAYVCARESAHVSSAKAPPPTSTQSHCQPPPTTTSSESTRCPNNAHVLTRFRVMLEGGEGDGGRKLHRAVRLGELQRRIASRVNRSDAIEAIADRRCLRRTPLCSHRHIGIILLIILMAFVGHTLSSTLSVAGAGRGWDEICGIRFGICLLRAGIYIISAHRKVSTHARTHRHAYATVKFRPTQIVRSTGACCCVHACMRMYAEHI